jgi:hypothetical protein
MNVRRATIDDSDIIRAVYGSPGTWEAVSDDNTPPLEGIDLSTILSNPVMCVLIVDDAAVFLFHPHNSVMFEMHSAVKPEFRGPQAVEAARMAGFWIFEHTPCMKIITLIPAGNVPAVVLARRGGMVKEGTLTASFLKGGRLIDQYVYGITKEAAKCL